MPPTTLPIGRELTHLLALPKRRRAYNAAFEAFECKIDGKPLVWSTEYYDILQNTVGGGKPKMRWHFKENGWPSSKLGPPPPESDEAARSKLVDDLQDTKTFHYKQIVDSAAEARPGVLALMDEGLAREDIAMAICSAATKEGFVQVVNSIVKPERLERFDVILAGDDVTKKKPDPLIYNMARERLGLSADRCIVIGEPTHEPLDRLKCSKPPSPPAAATLNSTSDIYVVCHAEDSMVGLRAAVGAGMKCIITPTASTASADFIGEGAAAVAPVLEGLGYRIKIDDLFAKDEGSQETKPHIRLPKMS